MSDIAIIGGGPKGVAVAAKAWALMRQARGRSLNITVFEHDKLAAAWRGGSGYTDGLQPLCTLAERDLGFPYDRASYGRDVASAMLSRFSWHAFAVGAGQSQAQYDQWVLHGRNPPSHGQFADYLSFAFAGSGAQLEAKQVVNIAYDLAARKWVLGATDLALGPIAYRPFDGVIVTGSGPALPELPLVNTVGVRTSNQRVFNGITFWTQMANVVSILAKEHPDDRKVVIIGAGGTAAAIAYWFVRQRLNVPITIVGREATLFARHPGFFEDRLFSEEADWSLLSDASRDEFVSRLTTGVVWDYVLRNLDAADIRYTCAQVKQLVEVLPLRPGLHPDLLAEVHPPVPRGTPWGGNVDQLEGAVFIDARGFDRWDFVSLLTAPLQAHFSNRQAVEHGVLDDLSVGMTASGMFPPRFHVPMLASRQGPAAPNLMALGWLSDRILRTYVPNFARIPPVTGSRASGP